MIDTYGGVTCISTDAHVTEPIDLYRERVETLMWGNDYPHPEGTWPRSQARCAEQFDGVAGDELAATVGGNAAPVFGFAL